LKNIKDLDMSYLADIGILSAVVDKLLQYSDKHKVRVNDAITSISKAWSYTYNYLRNENGEYVANQQLSDLWNDAASKTRLIDRELARQLSDKSRFWIHPDMPRQQRILLLTEVTDELERLNKKFE